MPANPPRPPVSPMARIFLSYSDLDRNAARTLAAYLKQFGHSILADPTESEPGGTKVLGAHTDIRNSGAVVILWSANAARSEWVRSEVAVAIEAWSEGKLVILRLDRTDLPPGLRDLPSITTAGMAAPEPALRDVEAAVAQPRATAVTPINRGRLPYSVRTHSPVISNPAAAKTRRT